MPHILLYFLAILSLSTSPNWAKLNEMPAEVLGFYRLGLAFLILSVLMSFRPKKILNFKLNTPNSIALISGLLFFLHLWTYKFAAKNTTIANTMILFAANPIWSSIGGVLIFKETIKKRLIVSYFVSFLGLFWLVSQDFSFKIENYSGNIAALISSLFFAGYMLSGKKARTQLSNDQYVIIQYGSCALLFLITALVRQSSFTGYSSVSWLSVLGLVLFPTFLGHYLMTYLLKYFDIGLLTCGKLIEPALAALMAYFIFNEQLSDHAWISFALVSTSTLLLFAPQIRSWINSIVLLFNKKKSE